MGIEAIVEKMQAQLAGGGFDRSARLDLGEDGSILIDGNKVVAGDGEADCVIRIARADLEQMLAGDLDPVGAFMSGKIAVEGDMSAAMALTQAI